MARKTAQARRQEELRQIQERFGISYQESHEYRSRFIELYGSVKAGLKQHASAPTPNDPERVIRGPGVKLEETPFAFTIDFGEVLSLESPIGPLTLNSEGIALGLVEYYLPWDVLKALHRGPAVLGSSKSRAEVFTSRPGFELKFFRRKSVPNGFLRPGLWTWRAGWSREPDLSTLRGL